MTPLRCLEILRFAQALLPTRLESARADVMLLAIAQQESGLKYRRQISGPARGYWQFERDGGTRGVMRHPASRDFAKTVLHELDYPTFSVEAAYAALEHNDLLAACFARLLLWTLPQALPAPEQPEIGWSQYLQAWRPGKPRPEAWLDNWKVALTTTETVV